MVKTLEKVDAVVVGSGWAGGVASAELTKKGYNVVCLERGAAKVREDFVGSKDELKYDQRKVMFQDLKKETLTVRNTLDEVASPNRSNDTNAINGTDTGGSGVHWNGMVYRWLPYDFEIRSKTIEQYGEDIIPKDMTMQDWGIKYDELEPYYDQFEKTMGVSGEPDPLREGQRSDDYPTPPMKETDVIRTFTEAAERLGYHPYRIASANLSETYTNPDGETINGCVYCAFCESFGCDFGAKSDPIATVLATAQKTGNFTLRNNSYAVRVVHEGGKATGIKFVDTETGEEFIQPADLVVVSGFTFTNTRLMLLSEIGKPYNPTDGTGVIGKNLTTHQRNLTHTRVRGFFDEKKFNRYAGAGALGVTMDDFNIEQLDARETGFLHGFCLRTSQRGDRPIGNNHVPAGVPSWGREFKDKSIFYANRRIDVQQQNGALPWRENYMDLDPTYKDMFGDPLLRVTSRFHEQDRNIVRYAHQRAKELLEEMGADHITVPEITEETEFNKSSLSDHTGGGVIMGADPETSAVNNYSQVWDMDNLFVVGASSFPHVGSSNPTATVGALAYRAAEGMLKVLEDGAGQLVQAAGQEAKA